MIHHHTIASYRCLNLLQSSISYHHQLSLLHLGYLGVDLPELQVEADQVLVLALHVVLLALDVPVRLHAVSHGHQH